MTLKPSFDARSPRILLIGIGGVYNYGCEAILRGTEQIIREVYPDADIVYASPRHLDDQHRLMGSTVRVVKRPLIHRYSIRNILRILLSMTPIHWDPITDSQQLLNQVDAILSIGGDLYTLGPGGRYSTSLAKYGEAAIRKGIASILWGASVGPFAGNPKAEVYFSRHLRRLSLIMAREPATVDYLHSLGIIDNVIPCADPAFVVAPDLIANFTAQPRDSVTIGVNLSPLSLTYSSDAVHESIHLQGQAIQNLIEAFNAKILLIPHVVCDFNEKDDDRLHLRKVKECIQPEYQKAVSLLDSDAGFIDVKKELVHCDVVLAARMHCAISALSARVPTILLSYSRKAEGMCQYVYGNRDWVMRLDDIATKGALENKMRSMLNQRLEIFHYLEKRIPDIQRDARRPGVALRTFLENDHRSTITVSSNSIPRDV